MFSSQNFYALFIVPNDQFMIILMSMLLLFYDQDMSILYLYIMLNIYKLYIMSIYNMIFLGWKHVIFFIDRKNVRIFFCVAKVIPCLYMNPSMRLVVLGALLIGKLKNSCFVSVFLAEQFGMQFTSGSNTCLIQSDDHLSSFRNLTKSTTLNFKMNLKNTSKFFSY
jgi:hypothetical protein